MPKDSSNSHYLLIERHNNIRCENKEFFKTIIILPTWDFVILTMQSKIAQLNTGEHIRMRLLLCGKI